VGLRMLEPGEKPFAGSLLVNVLEGGRLIDRDDEGAVGLGDCVAMSASIAGQQTATEVQLRGAFELVHVALSAGCFQIPCRKDGLFPSLRAVVCFGDCGCGALPVVASHAAKLI